MYKNRKVPAIVAVILMLSLITGCGQTTQPTTTAGTTIAGTTAAGTTATTTAKPKELVTLSAFIMQSASSSFGVEEDWMAEIMREKLNIQIEFSPAGDQVEQKMQAMMAGGELPDIIGFKESKYALQAVEAKMLLSMDDYATMMPNVFSNDLMANAVKWSKAELSGGQDKVFLIPTAVGPLGATADANWKPQLLWQPYTQIGRPEIGTLEDYLPVLKQMQDAYPKNAAGEKVYGLSIFSDWDSVTALQVSTLSFMYGIDTEYVSPLMETNVVSKEIKSVLDEDSFYKRALKFYYNANQMGLLDPDSLTQKFDTVQEKYTAGRILFSHFSWLTGQFNNRGSGNVDADVPNGYDMVPAKDFKIYDAPEQTIGRNWYLAAGAGTKYPERVAELLNWLYDIETYSLFSNGPKGVLWDIGANGAPEVKADMWTIIDNNEPMPLPGGGKLTDPAFNWNTLGYTGQMINPNTGYASVYRYWPASLSRNPTKLRQEWRDWTGYVNMAEYMHKENMIAPANQDINMVADPSDDLQMKINQIGDGVKTTSWSMIFAKNEAEFDKLWADMVAKADGLGMQEVESFYVQAWKDAQAKAAQYE